MPGGWCVPRAQWRSGASPSPMTEARGSCTTCRSTSRPVAAWASSARRLRDESRVGERGMQLSGGERQRIALARAYLRNAPILILDEPTSLVDLRTEAVILEALEGLMRGRTAFVITHRASALTTCDTRLQLERGRLVEATPSLLRRQR